jgi:hypothetical protein
MQGCHCHFRGETVLFAGGGTRSHRSSAQSFFKEPDQPEISGFQDGAWSESPRRPIAMGGYRWTDREAIVRIDSSITSNQTATANFTFAFYDANALLFVSHGLRRRDLLRFG